MLEKKPRKIVLVIANEVRTLRFISYGLISAGLDVRTCNAAEALDPISAIKPNVIIVDLEILPATCSELLQEIRMISQAPIIAMSNDSEVANKALQLGVNAFLNKPFSLKDLLNRIEVLIGPTT